MAIKNSMDSWGKWPQLKSCDRVLKAVAAMRQAISRLPLGLVDLMLGQTRCKHPRHGCRLPFHCEPSKVEPDVIGSAKEDEKCFTRKLRLVGSDACNDCSQR